MHPSDELLNEFLDGALPPETRHATESHLAACTDCAARLTALRTLFTEIESLPEVDLSRSLAVSVTRALNRRAALPRWLRLTAMLEAAGAVAGLALAAPVLGEFVASLTPALRLPSWTELLLQLQVQWMTLLLSVPEFTPPAIPTLTLDVSSLALTVTALGAFLFWVIGNGLLLKRMMKST